MSKVKVGILGYGNLGQYLVDQILTNTEVKEKYELAFIQNRSVEKIQTSKLGLEEHQIFGADLITNLQSFLAAGHAVDLIIEASHPDVILEHGLSLIQHAALFITSLTAFAEQDCLDQMLAASLQTGHQMFIPVGAGWGFADIKKMADAGTLVSTEITMEFHADALRLHEPLASALTKFLKDKAVDRIKLYQGPVRQLAKLAPNNVNTMCGLALIATDLGFDHVLGTLKATKKGHAHRVYISVEGPNGFYVGTERVNPAQAGAVTGSMTFQSFLASLMACTLNRVAGLNFV